MGPVASACIHTSQRLFLSVQSTLPSQQCPTIQPRSGLRECNRWPPRHPRFPDALLRDGRPCGVHWCTSSASPALWEVAVHRGVLAKATEGGSLPVCCVGIQGYHPVSYSHYTHSGLRNEPWNPSWLLVFGGAVSFPYGTLFHTHS